MQQYLPPESLAMSGVSGSDTHIEPCKIFVIEDSYDDQLCIRQELKNSEFVESVHCFDDGLPLLNYMIENGFMDHSVIAFTPMIFLVDIEMPGVDGLEIIRQIKKDPFLAEIPVIAITASESPEKLASAEEYGANGVFRKPFRRWMLDEFFQKAWKWPPESMWRV